MKWSAGFQAAVRRRLAGRQDAGAQSKNGSLARPVRALAGAEAERTGEIRPVEGAADVEIDRADAALDARDGGRVTSGAVVRAWSGESVFVLELGAARSGITVGSGRESGCSLGAAGAPAARSEVASRGAERGQTANAVAPPSTMTSAIVS